jgi:hypothetical protein
VVAADPWGASHLVAATGVGVAADPFRAALFVALAGRDAAEAAAYPAALLALRASVLIRPAASALADATIAARGPVSLLDGDAAGGRSVTLRAGSAGARLGKAETGGADAAFAAAVAIRFPAALRIGRRRIAQTERPDHPPAGGDQGDALGQVVEPLLIHGMPPARHADADATPNGFAVHGDVDPPSRPTAGPAYAAVWLGASVNIA